MPPWELLRVPPLDLRVRVPSGADGCVVGWARDDGSRVTLVRWVEFGRVRLRWFPSVALTVLPAGVR